MSAILAAALPPPAFSDLDKSSKDILNKDFYDAVPKAIEVRLTTPSGAKITTKASDTGSTPTASVEVKHTATKGVTLTSSTSTNAKINGKVEVEDIGTPGFKTEFSTDYHPTDGPSNSKLSFFFKQSNFHVRSFFSGELHKRTGSAVVDGVISNQGFLAGGEVKYDVTLGTIKSYQAALGFRNPLYTLTLSAPQKCDIVQSSFWQKVNSDVEVGGRVQYDLNDTKVNIDLAAKWKIDANTFAKIKANQDGRAWISYNTKVNQGFTFGVGSSFSTNPEDKAQPKFGANFIFEG